MTPLSIFDLLQPIKTIKKNVHKVKGIGKDINTLVRRVGKQKN
jgi:hypothetical protein